MIPIEIDFGLVRRQRQRGLLNMGQPLKSFRDCTTEFDVYGRQFDRSYLDSLGRLEKPERAKPSVERGDGSEDFYKRLGVTRAASAEEIAAAYSSKSGDAKADEAYDTLKDPVRRKLYDSLGHDEYLAHLKG